MRRHFESFGAHATDYHLDRVRSDSIDNFDFTEASCNENVHVFRLFMSVGF